MPRPGTADPHAAALVNAIAEAMDAADCRRASALADAGFARGIVHPLLFVGRALWLEQQGRDEDALACFHEARKLAPKEARILDSMGLCLTRLQRHDEAIRIFDEALGIEPMAALAHQRKGFALGLAGRLDEAERAYERASRLDPKDAETLASLASLAARTGNTARARDYAERTLKLDPRNASAQVALAQVDIAGGEFAAAERSIRTALDDPGISGHGRAVMLALLGDALDGEGRFDAAFETYAGANAERRRLHEDRFRAMRSASDTLEEIIGAFAAIPDDRWRAAADCDARAVTPARHVFLLGFPRSGTTLLGQALESHPDIATLDERDLLNDVAAQFLGSASALAHLATLDGASLAAHRDTYWQRVRSHRIKIESKVFVDKQPFNTIKLPLIAKLFPSARIIFAIRDPRDVALSSFRRQLDIDLLSFEFLTLAGVAGLYDGFMRLGELAKGKLPLAFLDYRYENLVANFDACTRAVCEFIGVTWSDSMRDFAASARSLAPQMASAPQLRRGLYAHGVGQWRNYRAQLEPILPILQPWIARFGYENESR
jgi:tetratricopeptide (TPR) repeat protein